MSGKRAVFFCSASNDIDSKYQQAAREAVRAACLAGYDIVSGGSFRGTMGVVCDTAVECGAGNYGALPEFMKGLEYQGPISLRWAPTMSERKTLMRDGVSVAIALPGGIGTMDELFETMVLAKLGRFKGRIAVLNVDGFYDPLKVLLDHLVSERMLCAEDEELVFFADNVSDLEAFLKDG
ncbi:MAG: TIGR00730 family Rossman fold protein [Bacteroidales bacterium]|nr:TIGR00730 family Rossman fold protein [Bacteroidales bacterium]